MGRWTDAAKKVRAAMNIAGGSLDDATASQAAAIYPELQYSGELVKAGTRIQWENGLKRAAVDLWDTEENNPQNAPDLWEDVMYRDGIRIIPETITAGLAFAKDERGWFHDNIYVSLIDANVWTPEQYPQGWKKEE